MWRDHRRYGYIINRTFEIKQADLVFHWCLYNKQNITYLLMDMNVIFSCSTRYLTRSVRSLVRYRVDHSKIKFISARGHVISSIYQHLIPNFCVHFLTNAASQFVQGTKPFILLKVCKWRSNGFLCNNLINWLSKWFTKWKSKPHQKKRKKILWSERNGRVTSKLTTKKTHVPQ